jgi:hypothetical protein
VGHALGDVELGDNSGSLGSACEFLRFAHEDFAGPHLNEEWR